MNSYSAPAPAEGTIRIGVGAGFAGDRFEPAVLLARFGQLDALVFECLAERTIAAAQERKTTCDGNGYDESIVQRVLDVVPHLAKRTLHFIEVTTSKDTAVVKVEAPGGAVVDSFTIAR